MVQISEGVYLHHIRLGAWLAAAMLVGCNGNTTAIQDGPGSQVDSQVSSDSRPDDGSLLDNGGRDHAVDLGLTDFSFWQEASADAHPDALGANTDAHPDALGANTDAHPDALVPDPSWVIFGGAGASLKIFGDSNGRSVGVDGQGRVWAATTAPSPIIITGGNLVSAGQHGLLLRLDAANGKLQLVQRLASAPATYGPVPYHMAVTKSRVFVGGKYSSPNGLGTKVFSSFGGYDGFVGAMDLKGTVLWALSFGGPNEDGVHKVQADSQGNVYALAFFSGKVTVGNKTLLSKGSTDAFLMKMDSGGKLLWVVQIGGTGIDTTRGLALDSSGNAYVLAGIVGQAFVGSQSVTPMPCKFAQLLAKISPSGKVIWAQQASAETANSGNVRPMAIATDAAGNVTVAGVFDGVVRIGQTKFNAPATPNGVDTYVAKVNSSGQHIWAAKAGAYLTVSAMALDVGGNALLTGYFHGTVTLGSSTISAKAVVKAHVQDVFVAKISKGGVWIGATSAGGSYGDRGQDIALDVTGNIYVAGTVMEPSYPITALVYDELTFGSSKYKLDGRRHLFVWKVPAGTI